MTASRPMGWSSMASYVLGPLVVMMVLIPMLVMQVMVMMAMMIGDGGC